MKKETFVQILNLIIESMQKEDEYAKATKAIYGDYPVYPFSVLSPLYDGIVKAIESELEDDERMVSWWLWDAPNAGKNGKACMKIGDKDIDIFTPEDLWNVIILV